MKSVVVIFWQLAFASLWAWALWIVVVEYVAKNEFHRTMWIKVVGLDIVMFSMVLMEMVVVRLIHFVASHKFAVAGLICILCFR